MGAWVIAVCAAVAFSTPIAVEAAGSPLNVSVQVGYRNVAKLGQWMPVSVDITNSGPDFDGTLELQSNGTYGVKSGPLGASAVYATPVSLGTGATKHFKTYVSSDVGSGIDVRIVQNGRVIFSQQAPTPNAASLLVGVLSDQPTTLDQLGALHPGGSVPGVAHISVADLPDSAVLLRGFDLIAIDDFSTDSLTAAQRSAIDDFVLNGGSLLLGAGGSWHKTLSGLPADLLPMNVTGSRVVTSGDLTGVEVATGTSKQGTTWMSDGDQPLLIEKHVGLGLVSMATFDWNQEQAAGWAQSTNLLREAFVRSTYGTGAIATSGMPTKFGFANSLSAKGSQFAQALSNLPALNLPALWLIGTLVIVYILLVGPINYLVLRAVNRRALAWVTVPAIALIGSGCAYGAGVATKGTAAQATEVSVLHVTPGSQHAYQETYDSLLTPTRGDYDVGISGARNKQISPIYTYFGQPTDGGPAMIRVNTASGGITLPSMIAFTPRGFASEGTTNAPDITGTSQLIGGSVTGTIQNHSSINFTDGVVLVGNNYVKLPALPPGGSLTFSLAPGLYVPFAGPGIYPQIYPNAYTCCPPQPYRNAQGDAEREAELRTAVFSTLPGTGYAGFTAGIPPTVVLWTKQPFQDITVSGSHPRTFAQDAVMVTLPVATIGRGSLPSGIAMGRVVDINGDFSLGGGPPGVLTAQSGSVVYEFTPPLAPGVRLGNALISSATPAYGGPKPVAGPLTPAVTGQVWDWAQSKWIAVNYAETGATYIPDSAVDPTTGMVRLKISSQGPFWSGYLSLTGAVS